MNVKSNSGFSLVELMVVVAIIGVLATVAVPNYMKFQAKAKQSNAKAELSGVYTAQKAYFVEYSIYRTNLTQVGYVPEGFALDAAGCPAATPSPGVSRHYNVGFQTPAALPAGTTAPANSCGGRFNFVAGLNNQALPASVQLPGTAPQGGGTRALTVVALGAQAAGQFTAGAIGKISSAATLNDIWAINQNNVMSNTTPGF